jgi:hypothetical protein
VGGVEAADDAKSTRHMLLRSTRKCKISSFNSSISRAVAIHHSRAVSVLLFVPVFRYFALVLLFWQKMFEEILTNQEKIQKRNKDIFISFLFKKKEREISLRLQIPASTHIFFFLRNKTEGFIQAASNI